VILSVPNLLFDVLGRSFWKESESPNAVGVKRTTFCALCNCVFACFAKMQCSGECAITDDVFLKCGALVDDVDDVFSNFQS
jgi:hypothetical protein